MPVARFREISQHVTALDLLGPFQVAVFFVRHARGLLLIDSGFPEWHYAILSAIEGLPAPNRITHVLLTHGHADHTGSASAVAAATGAAVLCSEEARRFVEGESLVESARTPWQRFAFRFSHRLAQRRVTPPRVSSILQPGDRLCGVRVLGTPGHSPGHLSFSHEADRVVIAGDAFFCRNGSVSHDPVPWATVDQAEADRSLDLLASLDFATLAPSHGPVLSADGPARLREFLASRPGSSVLPLAPSPPRGVPGPEQESSTPGARRAGAFLDDHDLIR